MSHEVWTRSLKRNRGLCMHVVYPFCERVSEICIRPKSFLTVKRSILLSHAVHSDGDGMPSSREAMTLAVSTMAESLQLG